MAFGWFSGSKSSAGKALEKGRKLSGKGRWAEALTYYDEAIEDSSLAEEARAGSRACRENLVELNLAEAQGFLAAGEPDRALDHAQLALELGPRPFGANSIGLRPTEEARMHPGRLALDHGHAPWVGYGRGSAQGAEWVRHRGRAGSSRWRESG